MSRLAKAAALAVTTILVGTGCGPGLQSFSVGRSVAGPSYPLTVVFSDAEGLPVGGHVELHNVTVGRVQSMQARDFKAYVQLRIESAVKLPTGTRAQLALTTPLGEEYIELMPPASPTTAAVIPAGATIPAGSTGRAPDVEDLFTAFSAVLNGGGIEQIRTITTELNKALAGKSKNARTLIANLNVVLSQLAAHTTEIDATLASIADLSRQLAGQRVLITKSLVALSPGIKDLSADTAGFTKLITRLSAVGRTATSVLNAAQGTLVSDLKGLQPTLDTLVSLRGRLPSTLAGLRRFAALLDRAVPGDFLNLNGTVATGK